MLDRIAKKLRSCVRTSRSLLLGSRDPRGPSCVPTVKPGDIDGTLPTNLGDYDGGAGTTLAILYFGDRLACKTPLEDYAWHQGRLRTFLENSVSTNSYFLEEFSELASSAQTFAEEARSWTSWPEGLTPVGYTDFGSWPCHCLEAINRAIGAKDWKSARVWASELASAVFHLMDLHRWLEFLARNQLCALDFQTRFKDIFSWANSRYPRYNLLSEIDRFPAGLLCLHALKNYYEVERQAEGVFAPPAENPKHTGLEEHVTDGSIRIPPRLRTSFLRLKEDLTPANAATLDQAARTPYEHGFLVSMLFRAWSTNQVEDVATVLRRFNANTPAATVPELMSVLLHRGHFFGGLEWSDRFLPQLMQVAGDLKGSNLEIFVAATQLAYKYFRSHTQYGYTFTLREALSKKKLDCVRLTDMIGAIYRNAGRPYFGHVWWCAGTSGHSVAAVGEPRTNFREIYLMDGMMETAEPQKWPDSYFQGAVWPQQLSQNAPPHAAELYLRAIDGYVWAQGYVIRGADMGTLVKAEIPYLPGHSANSAMNVRQAPAVVSDEFTALANQEREQPSKPTTMDALMREMGNLSQEQLMLLAEQARKLKENNS